MPYSSRDLLTRLDAYLDGLSRSARAGEPVEPSPDDVDPSLTHAVHRLRALDAAGGPDPALADQIWENLMDALALARTVPLAAPVRPAANGRAAPHPWPGWLPSFPESRGRRRLAHAQVATALMLVLTLVAVWVVSQRQPDNRIVAPPGTGTPAPSSPADMPIFRGNAARTGEMPGPGPTAEPRLRWQVQAPTGGMAEVVPINSFHPSPVVNDGLVFVGYPGGLDAIDVATGSTRWRFATGNSEALATPTVDGDSVYVAGFDGNLYSIDATTGEERWRAPVGDARTSSPVVADGIVYVTEGPFAGSPAVVGGLIFVGDGFEGELLARDAATGTERWRFSPPARGLFALDAVSGEERWHVATEQLVHTTPAVADGVVYFSDYDDMLYAVDATGGTERWRVQVGEDQNRVVQPGGMIASLQSSAAVAGGVVYAAAWDGTLAAIAASSGTELWRAEIGFGVFSSPAVAGAGIYIGGMDGTLHAFDAATGRPRWEVGVDGPIGSSPVVTDGAVFVLRSDGALLRLD